MPRFGRNTILSIDDSEEGHEPSLSISSQRNRPHASRRSRDSPIQPTTRRNNSTLPNSLRHSNLNGSYDPLLYLFMTICNPLFQSNPVDDRRTIRYLARLIPIADGDSGLDLILETTRVHLEHAERNRRRATRLQTRVQHDSPNPFRDLLSDDENESTNNSDAEP
jgi:hypothetical protein